MVSISARPVKIPGVGEFAVVQGQSAALVDLGANAAQQIADGYQTLGAQEADLFESLQVVDEFFKAAIHFRQGAVDVGLDRHEFDRFGVGAAALGLRRREGAFNFVVSHICLIHRRIGQGALSGCTLGVAR